MKIYWLCIGSSERPVFYSELSKLEGEELSGVAAARGGLRGWAEEKYVRMQKYMQESEQGVGRRIRQTWEWLHARVSPHEWLLRSLRNATSIEIYHPTGISTEAARETWEKYIAGRRRHHLLWFAVNAVIAPATLLLMVIPGPNVIGYSTLR